MSGESEKEQKPDDPFAALAGMIGSTPQHSAPSKSSDQGDASTALGTPPDLRNYTPGPRPETTDAFIGPYKLLEQVGEGGMGAVYLAEQTEPVRRKVALKVIKPGMASGQIIARFEAERQALAMMDHPNIAKVFDAGTTPSGQPYFAMELVNGVPITKYCDKMQLPLRERLELFVQVCKAIQHAHQKGIIHRDIKPSNVLVALQDGKPVPKVIDFGVAKALNQKLTDNTLYTQVGALIGTLEYMSPEQAEMSALGIDVRSDIYSLGVLLYELLTGSTPLNRKVLRESALVDLLRRIREEEPPKPSTRLTTANPDELSTIAKSRKADQSKLSRQLQGELDWIALRALEKDRTRRYESANGLARDVERYLADEPVEACPPSNVYRFRKFTRRNKTLVFATGVVAAALVIGIGVSTWMYFKEKEARRNAEVASEKSKQIATFLKEMLGGVGPSVALGRDTKMLREILDKTAERMSNDLKNQPEVEADLQGTIARVYRDVGDLDKAEALFKRALELQLRLYGKVHAEIAETINNIGGIRFVSRDNQGAESMIREALVMRKNIFGNEHPKVVESMHNLSYVLMIGGNLKEAESLMREALAANIKLLGNDHLDVARCYGSLAMILTKQKKLSEAKQNLLCSLTYFRKTYGENHPLVSGDISTLANISYEEGNYAESEKQFREALQIDRNIYGADHSAVTDKLRDLSTVLIKSGDYEGASKVISELLPKAKKNNTVIDWAQMADLIVLMNRNGKCLAAEPFARLFLTNQEVLNAEDSRYFHLKSLLGDCLLGQKRYLEAEPLLLAGYEGLKKREDQLPEAVKQDLVKAAGRLVQLYQETGEADKAAEWRAKYVQAVQPR